MNRHDAGGVRSAPRLGGGWARTRRPKLRIVDRAAERIRRLGLRGDLVDELWGSIAAEEAAQTWERYGL